MQTFPLQTFLCCSREINTCTFFIPSAFCLILSHDLSNYEISHLHAFCFVFILLIALWTAWDLPPSWLCFPCHPSIPHTARHIVIVSTQNPGVIITLTERLLWARYPSKHFTFIISFNLHRDYLLTLNSEGGGGYGLYSSFTHHWLFSFSLLWLHCLPHVFYSPSPLQNCYLFLIASLLIIYVYILLSINNL